MTDDELDTPNCPVHLVPLEAIGDAPDICDARWECDGPGCMWVRLA